MENGVKSQFTVHGLCPQGSSCTLLYVNFAWLGVIPALHQEHSLIVLERQTTVHA